MGRMEAAGHRAFTGLTASAVATTAAVGVGLAHAARTGYQEMVDAERASAQTAAAIRSTGGAAHVTQAQVEALAGRLQGLTGITDDSIQSAENLMLTFTKVSGETFPRAIQAALDLSVAFHKDLGGSATMVGKALQDPIKGVSALSRVGVSFTAQQKDQIKALVDSGEAAKAQTLILRELERQVGGSGKALGQTLPGQLARLQRRYEDISQGLVERLSPAFSHAADVALTKLAPAVQQVTDDLAHIATADISVDRKFELAWKRIDQTGVPDAVRGAVEKGIVAAATNGPRLLVQGFREAPWEGQAVLGTILLAKFGPGLKVAGSALAKALGLAAKGAGLATIADGLGGVQKVFVVNQGFGGAGGAPAGVGRWGFGAAGLSAAAAPAAAGAAVIGGLALGGVGLDKLGRDGKLGFLGIPSEAENKAAGEARGRALIEGYRKGAESGIAAAKKNLGGAALFDGVAERTVRQADDAVAGFVSSWHRAEPRVKGAAKGVVDLAVAQLGRLPETSRQLAQDSMVRMAAQMEKSGQAPKGTTQRLVGELTKRFGDLPAATREAARQAVWELSKIEGKLLAVSTAARGAAAALLQLTVNAGNPSVRRIIGGSTGGHIPGTYRGVDDRLMMVASGEAILTPQQQAMVPGGRATLDRIFAQTGGRIGGTSFATGGVAAAQAFAASNRGEPYSNARRLSGSAWDCSSFAGSAAIAAGAQISRPGTTATYVREISAYRKDAPIVFGFRPYRSSSGYDGGNDEHMGIRINGVWWESGGRGNSAVGPGKSTDASWSILGVPRGLENLGADEVVTGTSSAGGGADTTGGVKDTPAKRRADIATGRALTRYRPTVSPGDAVQAGITTRHRDDTLQDDQVGDRAESSATAAGVTNPQKVAALRQRAIDQTRIAELQQDRTALQAEFSRIQTVIANKRTAKNRHFTAMKRRGVTAAERQRHLDAIREINSDLDDLDGQARAVLQQIADIEADLALLGNDVGDQDRIIATQPDVEPVDTSTTSSGSDAGTGTELSAADRAAIDYAGRSDAFIRTMFGSPDIGQGGRSPVAAAAPAVNVTVQALHPGSPSVLADIAAAVTAAFTGGTWQASTTAASGA